MNDLSEAREVRSLLDEPGCVPCLAQARGGRRYLHQVLWEGVTDLEVRRRLRDSGGFCREHFAVAIDLGRDEGLAPGLAIIVEDLLGRLETEAKTWGLDATGGKAKAGRRSRAKKSGASTSPLPCPACLAAIASADRALWLLARIETGTALAKEVDGVGRTLCIPHLRRGLEAATTDSERVQLRTLFGQGAARTKDDLAGFIRKSDHRHRDEAMTPEEATSWEGAPNLIVGALPFRRRR